MQTISTPNANVPLPADDTSQVLYEAAARPGSMRVLAIDVLRGITVGFMILVNDPGDGTHVYRQLDHAEWNGWTMTDLVFPNFLFLVGASTIFSLDGRLRRGESRSTLAAHLFLRAGKIFLLDLLLMTLPYFHLTQLRLYGVLTRIALCYLIGGLILLWTRKMRVLAGITGAILAAYWAILRWIPVPGYGIPGRDIPFMDMQRNLVSWIDRGITAFLQRTIHTGVLWEGTRDPEGLLSTLPAVATVLIGAMAALWLRRNAADRGTASRGLVAAGAMSFAAGVFWGRWFPINKNMWTSSYVLMAAGWALVGLGIFYWLVDDRHLHETTAVGRWLARPAMIFGSNAITAYAVSGLLAKALLFVRFNDGGKMATGWGYTYQHVFARGSSTEFKSLLFSMAFVGACFVPNWILFRRKIFLKI